MNVTYDLAVHHSFHSRYMLGYGASEILPNLLQSIAFDKLCLISDTTLPSPILQHIASMLPSNTIFFEIACTEKDKTWATAEHLIQCFQNQELSRNCLIIAVGGGVLGDIVGFVTSIYKRGVRWAFIPTTLVAQIDSSIGGKTAVNTPFGKNLLGSFYPPLFVVADIALLESLPLRHLQAGMAEIIKIAAIADSSLFDQLDEHAEFSLPNMVPLFSHAAELKIAIVQDDPFETKEIGRNRLNFGHTIGHAIETCLQPSILHGEAIALGMLAEIEIAEQLDQNQLSYGWKYNLENLIKKYVPYYKEFSLPSWNSLLPYIKQDKKNEDQYITLIIPAPNHQVQKIKFKVDQKFSLTC